MSDNNPTDVVFGQLFIDMVRQIEQDRLVDTAGVDITDLVPSYIRNVQDVWDGIDELLYAESNLVADRLSVAGAL